MGACTLALPLAFTEEVWNLGEELHILADLTEPVVAINRTILTSLPASFLATAVDGLH